MLIATVYASAVSRVAAKVLARDRRIWTATEKWCELRWCDCRGTPL